MTLVVLTGGARAGKSAFALDLAGRWEGDVVFVATAEARDEEMATRIERHRSTRPSSWTTVEEPVALRTALESLAGSQLAVVDCVTLWVANLLERGGSEDEIVGEARKVANVAAARTAPVIAVTNEVGLGVVPATPLGRTYRDVLGAVNREFVARADDAGFVVAGRVLRLDVPEAFTGWT